MIFQTRIENPANIQTFTPLGNRAVSSTGKVDNSEELPSANLIAMQLTAQLDQAAQALRSAGITESALLDTIPQVRADALENAYSPEFLARIEANWRALHPETLGE